MPRHRKPLDLAALVRALHKLPQVAEWLAWQQEADLAASRARFAVRKALRRRGLGWFGRSMPLDWLRHAPPDAPPQSEPAPAPLALPSATRTILTGALGRELVALPRVQTWLTACSKLKAAKLAGQAGPVIVDATRAVLVAQQEASRAVRVFLRRREYSEAFVRSFQLDWLLAQQGE